MKLSKIFSSCIILSALLSVACVCNAQAEPDVYVYEAETTPYAINGVENSAPTETEDEVTYIIYKNEKNGANDNVTFNLDVPEAGRYEVTVRIKKVTTDGAYYSWKVDDNTAKYKMYFTGSRFQNQWLNVDLGQHEFTEGTHTVGMYCSSNLKEIQIDSVIITKSNNQTFFIISEYRNGNVNVSETSTPIATAVENDVYATVVYEAKAEDEYISINLTTETCGLFDISFIIKSGGSTAGTFDFYIDNVLISEAMNLKNYGKGDWTEIDFGRAKLSAGPHEFKLVCNINTGRALLSELKLNAVREGFGIFAPEMSDDNGPISGITDVGTVYAKASAYNYEEDKNMLIVQMYYDKIGTVSVLKDIVIKPYIVKSGECAILESDLIVTDLSENVTVSAFVCDYTEGILYPDSEIVTLPCELLAN